ncbi:hypothetical protein [Micromonospora sp. CA-244673]
MLAVRLRRPSVRERVAGRLSPRCVDGLVAILLAASATTAIVTAARN